MSQSFFPFRGILESLASARHRRQTDEASVHAAIDAVCTKLRCWSLLSARWIINFDAKHCISPKQSLLLVMRVSARSSWMLIGSVAVSRVLWQGFSPPLNPGCENTYMCVNNYVERIWDTVYTRTELTLTNGSLDLAHKAIQYLKEPFKSCTHWLKSPPTLQNLSKHHSTADLVLDFVIYTRADFKQPNSRPLVPKNLRIREELDS